MARQVTQDDRLRRWLGRPARWLGLTVGTTALAFAGAAAPASGSPTVEEPGAAVVNDAATSAAEQASVAEYWTPERMESAVPFEQLVRGQAAPGLLRQADRAAADVGNGNVSPLAFPELGAAWTGGGDVVQTTGRVFFSIDGQNAACSGSAVVSQNKSTVITAGHCVKYQGSWHTNWVFVPGYDEGATPYGTWTASSTLTTPQWDASEDLSYDVGAGVVNPLDGELLTDVVGGQDIAFNQPRNPAMYAFGYPAADPYDGERLIYCSGNTFTDFLFSTDHGMACDMTGGSSGGPWFVNFDEATGTGALNGVNSFGYIFLPNYMFGPYFGDEAQGLYELAESS